MDVNWNFVNPGLVLENQVSLTFLCGVTISTSACSVCHPSCSSCQLEAGKCDDCAAGAAAAKTADGAVCVCNSGFGPSSFTDRFHTACGACHASCQTCEFVGDVSKCTNCSGANRVLPPYTKYGLCVCRDGYVREGNPTSPCVPCAPAGCPYCSGPDESECMPRRAVKLSAIAFDVGLPYLTETEDHRICYRQKLPESECTPDPIEYIAGSITDYAGIAKPTRFQCNRLLAAQWPYVIKAFDSLFPNFLGPNRLTNNSYESIQSFLHLLILTFGYAEVNTWTDLKAAWNAPSDNWDNYLAWIDTAPGYTLDGGATVKAFPAALLQWLTTSCADTYSCMELATLFNDKSVVCEDLGCSATIKGYCMQVDDGSNCADQ